MIEMNIHPELKVVLPINIELLKRLKLREFSGLPMWCMPTGSSIYGVSEPSDMDYIVLEYQGLVQHLVVQHGWVPGGSYKPGNEFISLKKGFVNLIIGSTDFVEQWINAHDFCCENPIRKKEDRIRVFETFRSVTKTKTEFDPNEIPF